MSELGALYIDGRWVLGKGRRMISRAPWDSALLWAGAAANPRQITDAVSAAQKALPAWIQIGQDRRRAVLEKFADLVRQKQGDFARVIALETGRPLWETLNEVGAVIGKCTLTIRAFSERRSEQHLALADAAGAVRYKAHGVAAVFGPFNMPAHLPNGHIMPALLAGNTIVFKPSELAPLTAQRMVGFWEKAGVPSGVLNLVQGSAAVGSALADDSRLDAIFFTGSFAAGQALAKRQLDFPQRILALEMGGNNPLVVWKCKDPRAAAYHTIVSAYLTAGQRCTCARRLIVSSGKEGEKFLSVLLKMVRRICIGGPFDDPPPFMGPLISETAAERVLSAQKKLFSRGAKSLLDAKQSEPCKTLLAPGIIDVTKVAHRPDEEVFGPLLQVIRVDDFDAAIAEANNTRFGLAAGLLSDRAELFERFYSHVRAGVINFNRSTNGASSELPFGGVGYSGNQRPSGYWAADYSSYPVAVMETPTLALPDKPFPGVVA
ncbi:MAG TPA: succinylglutamate-semialdehyde dehydrogenase [Phycisphaerae bacterium]|nr:succinylglutamate-semialdehyde dehydrogenase [Phycisphaerae bacterium]